MAGERENLNKHMTLHCDAITASVERRFGDVTQALLGLKALALSDPNLTKHEFDVFAANLVLDLPELRSFQLSPEGVVTFVYP